MMDSEVKEMEMPCHMSLKCIHSRVGGINRYFLGKKFGSEWESEFLNRVRKDKL